MIKPLHIALVQSDLHWENSGANMAMFEEKIWSLQSEVDLIVLPEMFTTGFSMNAHSLAEPENFTAMRWMRQMAAQTKAVICGSYILKIGGKYYNRFYSVYPDGSNQWYDKRHLFTLAGEGQDYTPGEERIVFEVKGWKILPQICYDLRFPVWSRNRSSSDQPFEYDLVMYVANWPKPRIHAWDTLLAARAVENLAYSVGVNRLGIDGVGATYVGHSAVYDFYGQSMVYSEQEEVLVTSLDYDKLTAYRKRFPFQLESDNFEIKS